MLVYGDRSERADSRDVLQKLAERVSNLRALGERIERHSELTNLLIEGGRLLQGIADQAFALSGEDRRNRTTDALWAWLIEVARQLLAIREGAELTPLGAPLNLSGLRGDVELREPEGYAFYALYPESYADAARTLQLAGPPCVIGIRSMGTSLGAMVAAATDARLFVTVRPFGDPFARRIAVGTELEAELLEHVGDYLIVDEGPGQSGSSFAAVAKWLEDRGVDRSRIVFMPSHDGAPGPDASETVHERWSERRKAVADFADLPEALERWVKPLIGELDEPLIDVSGGAWRGGVFDGEAAWPAAAVTFERRKFLARARGEHWLLKFAGLSDVADRKLRMSGALSALGLTPEPIGIAHGFLVERWHEDAERLTADDRPLPEIAAYIGTRARLFPALDGDGASPADLLAMAKRNTELVLGTEAAEALERWEPRLNSLAGRIDRVRTDNRMDPHEWLRLPDGRILKTDAVDHHAAHDLIGAQDIAWDVAGAAVEFALSERETGWLAAQAGREACHLVDPELLEFLTQCYLAFRLGQASLAAGMTDPSSHERRRLQSSVDRYAARLQGLLLQPANRANPQESAVDEAAERTASGTILQ